MVNPHQPDTLAQLIERLYKHSERYDFSYDEIIKNGFTVPEIGEWTYGTSYVPTYWVLGYLMELQRIREEQV